MMRFLALISDMIGSVLDIPYRFIQTIGKWRALKGGGVKTVGMFGQEVKGLSPVASFFRGAGFILFVLVAIAALGGAIYGLWWLNRAWELERQLGGPLPWARPYWLPALLVLFLTACIAGWWLWSLVGPLREPTDFADIYTAWVEGRAALEANGLVVTDLPVYLVIGRPASGAGSFFAASRIGFPVAGVPARGDAPVQVYGSPQGIFVACPGVSLLSRWAELLAADLPQTATGTSQTLFDESAPMDAAAAHSVAPTWPLNPLLLADETGGGVATAAPTRLRTVPALLRDGVAADRELARLRYLGRLVAHNRHPYCGVNGVVLLVPFASLESEAATNQAVTACKLDLNALREGLKIECPILGVVCDLEQADGAAAFLRAVGDDRKDRLLGQPFPLAADVPTERLNAALLSTVHWSGDGLDRIVLRAIKVGDTGSEGEALVYNGGLCRFAAAVRQRESAMGEVFSAAATGPDGRPARFGGCFLAATGPDPARDQAFVGGLFRLLAEQQNYVTWTAAAKSEDAAYRGWTAVGYLTLFAFIVAVAVALVLHIRESLGG
ncbi:type VI secretion protein IcmF/TssM N-terminal domain-containing protein [Limnoglobus roseus]|uniref:Type VI secretion system component TssM1 N-terminal domain-containing protein n=1 Tax=Limnoglobus roseus TaxID=2598579 RepID=A0A5C1ARB3_9BACT|nr:type VI secretion protein IcmF/TssM N-terminal domain-containing protein [Limnoglobus roseus]QEL19438.1 hypothetical protein PX52LOC_06510 [Limnoglobus roseus]